MRTLPSLMLLLMVAAAPSAALAEPSGWVASRDEGFGFTYAFPSEAFAPREGDGRPSVHIFESQDARAKLLFTAWRNEEGQTPAAFKQWLIANTEGYDELTYRPRGRSWFVLSGYRDDNIYYEKVMFSCGGNVVNVFGMSYPVAERSRYDPIVERIEDQFRPGKGC